MNLESQVNNFNNYYVYSNLIRNGSIVIKTDTISLDNWSNHYYALFSILQDGIELKELHQLFITVQFRTGETVDLTITDFLFNLMLWYPIIALGRDYIQPKHLMFKKFTNSRDIKKFIDKFFIIPNRKDVHVKVLNNTIAHTLYPFLELDEFSLFLANTLNLEDDIELMQASPEFDSLIHCDMSDVPIEQVKNKGMEVVNKAIDIILNSKKIMGHEHCLKNAFAAGEGINKKQYRENHYNIGTKPDGQGSIYHEIINQSYITGGLNNYTNQFIDCATARVAQIISKKNVGESGGFSRILGLNNIDTFLNPDPNYKCQTRNLIPITISNSTILNRMKNRTFRYVPEGIEFELDPDDESLVGKTLYFRSPITCASYARGTGICHACYGRSLANINSNINTGRIATEIVTEQYTQMRLSAKHLLESLIKTITWSDSFNMFFNIEVNNISLSESAFNDDVNPIEDYVLRIREDEVMLENDDDFFKHLFYSSPDNSVNDVPIYNEYVTDINIINIKTGEEYLINSVEEDGSCVKMFISQDMKSLIRTLINKNKEEYLEADELNIPLRLLLDKNLFSIKIQNNDLGKALDVFTDLINKKDVTKTFTIPDLVGRLQTATINGNINVDSIHLEVILANQVRNINDRLEKPDWNRPNESYEILTLNEALTDNPSPVVSLLYQKLAKVLYYPLTYKKIKPSIFDPFFMRKPKKFLNVNHEVYDLNEPKLKPGYSPVVFFDKNGKRERPKNMKEFLRQFKKEEDMTELED